MIRQFYLVIFIAATISVSCQNQKPISATNEAKQTVSEAPKLETHLRTVANNVTADSVQLSFTVINNADTAQQFCKWETPFEPRLGKYMEIIDQQGNEAQFTGAMARRVMPPPTESYIQVPPHDSVRIVFDLAKNYSLKSGQYTVRYIGGGISGLQSGNEIKISIKGH